MNDTLGAPLGDYDPQAFFTQIIPRHRSDGSAPVRVEVLHEWPAGTFVENVHVGRDGTIYASVLSEKKVVVYRDGAIVDFARFDRPTLSLFENVDGTLLVFAGEVGEPPGSLYAVDGGATRLVAAFPDALFLNGSAPFVRGSMLVADSLRGRIFHVELATGAVSTWLEHDLLGKGTSERMLPAANGLKVFGRTVYVSNTDRALVLAIDFDASGSPAEPRILASELRADDFAFDVAGNAYLTTHIHNTILRLGRDGSRVDLAGPAEGLAGSTAVAFGRTAADARSLYATTTGGIIAPYRGTLQGARLLRLEVGSEGAPIAFVEA